MAARPAPPLPRPPPQEEEEAAASATAAAPGAADVEGLAHYVALGFEPPVLERLRRAGCDPAARQAAVTAADVRAAWLRAARRWHPDKQRQRRPTSAAGGATGAAAAASAFVRARLAYDVLGDARSRRAYDLLGAEAGLAAARAAGGAAASAAGGKRGGGNGGGGGGGGWARGAAGAVPVTVWYGDEEGDDVAAGAAAAAHEAALCVEDMVRRLMLEEGAQLEQSSPSSSLPPAPAAAPLSSLDPSRQLALLCELCPRPSSRTCWTCGAALCAFCSRRPHYALHGAPLSGGGGGNNNDANGRRNGRRRRRRRPGLVPAHYPLIDAPGSMAETLGRQEWEQKRLEDARRTIVARAPGLAGRSEAERRALREFLEGEGEEEGAGEGDDGGGRGRQRRRCYYRWSASRGGFEARLAVFLPTGGGRGGGGDGGEERGEEEEGAAHVEIEGRGGGGAGGGIGGGGGGVGGGGASLLLLSAYSRGASKKVIDRRRLALPVALGDAAAVEVRSAAGGRAVVVRLPLASPPSPAARLFDGDEPAAFRRWRRRPSSSSSFASSSSSSGGDPLDPHRPLYSILEEEDDNEQGGGGVRVVFERLLPWWVDAREDVEVDCFFLRAGGRLGLRVRVGGLIDVGRTYAPEAAAALGDPERCAWWCDGGNDGGTSGGHHQGNPPSPLVVGSKAAPPRTLSVFVPLRPPTAEERAYKAGVRQDHRAAARRVSPLAPWLSGASAPASAFGGGKGVAFFEEDEDEFGLDALLQALDEDEEEAEKVGGKPE